MARYQIATTQWLELSNELRNKIATMFDLKKGAGAKVYGTRLISDGYTNENLQGVTVEKINAVMGTSFVEEEILKAFHGFVEFIKNNKNIENGTEAKSSQQVEGTNSNGNEGKTANAISNGTPDKDTETILGNVSSDSSVADTTSIEGGENVKSVESDNAGTTSDIPSNSKGKSARTSKVS